MAATRIRPVLEIFEDFVSDTRDDTLTPGGAAEIRGSHLKVDPDNSDEGIFFIAADGTETKVQTIMRNMPVDLIFMVPDSLASGEYDVEVRSLGGHTTIRTGRLESPLVVA